MNDKHQPNARPDDRTISGSEAAIAQAWQAQLAQAAHSPALAATLLRQSRALYARFVAAYRELLALSRQRRRKLLRNLGASLAGAALALALSHAPLAYAFPPSGNASLNGSAPCDLIDAITAANTDTATGTCPAGLPGADTITLLTGVALTSINNGVNGLPQIASVITIEGAGFTIARDSGAPNFRILDVTGGGDLTLNNTTISGGFAAAGYVGGGIMNQGALTLNNSTVSGNGGGNGAGIYNGFGKTATLNNSTVSGNSTGSVSGGIMNQGTLTLNNSTVSGNTSPNSAGGISNGGTLILSNSTVSGNTANNDGGGISNGGTLTLSNSTVSGNTAQSGGGIYNVYGTLTLERSLISGNSASSGREIFNYVGGCLNAAAPSRPNCLASVASVDIPLPAADPNLFGYSGETNAQAFYGFTPDGSDITATSNGTLPTALGSILNTTLANNGGGTLTHALVAGSPAVDANTGGPATDQRGVARPQGAAFDIGAFELEQAAATATPTNTPAPTDTPTTMPTNTPVPTNTPTATPTNTPVPPTATPTPGRVNGQLLQLSSVVVSSTTHPDPTYPAQSPKGVVVSRIVVLNLGVALKNVYFKVVSLSNNDYLLNADGGPGQAGSQLSVPNATLFGGNQSWDHNELLAQDFRVGLLSRKSFLLLLDVYANKTAVTTAQFGSADTAELVGSFQIEVDPEATVTTGNTIYLPVVSK